jgi:acetyl esterase/lipase
MIPLRYAFGLLVLCSATVFADSPDVVERVDLYPGTSVKTTDSGDRPQLIISPSPSTTEATAGILVLPGGGYGNLAIDHEGHQIARWMHSLGIRPAICTYRHKGRGNDGQGYRHPIPMQDAQRAIAYLRANAEKLNLDPKRIGVIGFSAGGHLASTVSTHFTTAGEDLQGASSRPDFSILCYPVIAFDQPFTHRGSQRNLLGENPDSALVESLSNEKQVTPETPPTFLFHTVEDTAVPVQNSLAYATALANAGVRFELAVFPSGRHGVGLGKDIPGANQWPELCAEWLREIGMRP